MHAVVRWPGTRKLAEYGEANNRGDSQNEDREVDKRCNLKTNEPVMAGVRFIRCHPSDATCG